MSGAIITYKPPADARPYVLDARDQFALAAMQGAAASSVSYGSPAQAAADAYRMADAMMSERDKNK